VSVILDDLTTLSPKRLEKHLEALARDALACNSMTVFDGNPEDGLTVSLRVDSRQRADVRDLARVVEDDGVVSASCSWSALSPSRRHPESRLLLRVGFERPVVCSFTVVFAVTNHLADPLRADLPLLLAAHRLVFDFDGRAEPGGPVVWIAAPLARECVLDVLAGTRL
jgi:hypothetical protein